MSWNVATQTGQEFFGDEIEAGIQNLRSALPEGLCEEAWEQFEDAAAVVRDLIAGGTIGPADGENKRKFRLSLSGHANTDHMPDPDWANDALMISISQVNPE